MQVQGSYLCGHGVDPSVYQVQIVTLSLKLTLAMVCAGDSRPSIASDQSS